VCSTAASIGSSTKAGPKLTGVAADIPKQEVVVVFDADMVCKTNFFRHVSATEFLHCTSTLEAAFLTCLALACLKAAIQSLPMQSETAVPTSIRQPRLHACDLMLADCRLLGLTQSDWCHFRPHDAARSSISLVQIYMKLMNNDRSPVQ
jgi:hypothetical protein